MIAKTLRHLAALALAVTPHAVHADTQPDPVVRAACAQAVAGLVDANARFVGISSLMDTIPATGASLHDVAREFVAAEAGKSAALAGLVPVLSDTDLIAYVRAIFPKMNLSSTELVMRALSSNVYDSIALGPLGLGLTETTSENLRGHIGLSREETTDVIPRVVEFCRERFG